MALYFFHIQTDTRDTDVEGTEFATALEARARAIVLCGELMKDAAESFWGTRPWSVTVTGANGLILWDLFMNGFASPAAAHLK